MPTLTTLLEKNKAWAERMCTEDPEFFQKLAKEQKPNYLWIGCADSRVPASVIVGPEPGEIFVHRNVGNVVVHTDLNCLSVLQYAVEQLHVEHIIICGHYGCGGVQAALEDAHLGLIDNWLRCIRVVKQKYEPLLKEIDDDQQRFRKLCELNVIEQVVNVGQTTVVEQAWERGQELYVYGWIYCVSDGLIDDLTGSISNQDELAKAGAQVTDVS